MSLEGGQGDGRRAKNYGWWAWPTVEVARAIRKTGKKQRAPPRVLHSTSPARAGSKYPDGGGGGSGGGGPRDLRAPGIVPLPLLLLLLLLAFLYLCYGYNII